MVSNFKENDKLANQDSVINPTKIPSGEITEDLKNTVRNLILISENTKKSVYGIPQIFNPINNYFLSKQEFANIIKIFKVLHAKKTAQINLNIKINLI